MLSADNLIILIIVLLIVIICIAGYVTLLAAERARLKAAGLEPAKIEKEYFGKRLYAFLKRYKKVYFETVYEAQSSEGTIFSLNMFVLKPHSSAQSIDKLGMQPEEMIKSAQAKKSMYKEVVGKLTYLLSSDRVVRIQLFSVSKWDDKNTHPDRLIGHFVANMARKRTMYGKVERMFINLYPTDMYANLKLSACVHNKFKVVKEFLQSGYKVQMLECKVR